MTGRPASIARSAFVLTMSRFANYGLMLISPIILVRFLSVAEFGKYREFLVYATLMQSFATVSINDSLLYFVPKFSDSPWRVVRQTAILLAFTSVVVMLVAGAADFLSSGALFGIFRVQLILYVLLFVNIDFWEYFWLARHRQAAVFAYTAGRLLARMLVVVGVSAATSDVQAIIWALIFLELARFLIAMAIWRWTNHEREEPSVSHIWREQLQFCIPAGCAVLLSMANRSLGSLVVAKALGVVALAQLTIGTYGEPLVIAIRNSISTVLLPEMVRQNASGEGSIGLWRRTTVINCILIFPAMAILLRYAEPLVTTVFGHGYLPAAIVMQAYTVIMFRSCFDFSPPLRAVNRTKALLFSNFLGLAANAVFLYFMVPLWGILGAMSAWIAASLLDAVYLGVAVSNLYGTKAVDLLPWRALGKVGVCAAAASLVILSPWWIDLFGFAGVFLGSAAYGVAFIVLLLAFKVPEAHAMASRIGVALGRFAR